MSNLLIIGAGGQGKCVAEIASLMNKWENIAFLDEGKVGQNVLAFPVLPTKETYETFKETYDYAFVAIGDNEKRLKIIRELIEIEFKIPILIHPKSIVSAYSTLQAGTVVHAGAVVNPDAKIGMGCIINTGATVDHDCVLGDGVHLSPGSHLGGNVTIGDLTWLGIGSSVKNNIQVGSNSVVAGNAMVIRNVEDNVMVAGVPAIVKKGR